jgi:hypothetical protein
VFARGNPRLRTPPTRQAIPRSCRGRPSVPRESPAADSAARAQRAAVGQAVGTQTSNARHSSAWPAGAGRLIGLLLRPFLVCAVMTGSAVAVRFSRQILADAIEVFGMLQTRTAAGGHGYSLPPPRRSRDVAEGPASRRKNGSDRRGESRSASQRRVQKRLEPGVAGFNVQHRRSCDVQHRRSRSRLC